MSSLSRLIATFLFIASTSAFADEPQKFIIKCTDIDNYGTLSFQTRVWPDRVALEVKGHDVPSIVDNLGHSIENINGSRPYAIRIDAKLESCKFSDEFKGVFSCAEFAEDGVKADIFTTSNTLLKSIKLKELNMALFAGTRHGYNYHVASARTVKGYQFEMRLKDADSNKVTRAFHNYFYSATSECVVEED